MGRSFTSLTQRATTGELERALVHGPNERIFELQSLEVKLFDESCSVGKPLGPLLVCRATSSRVDFARDDSVVLLEVVLPRVASCKVGERHL